MGASSTPHPYGEKGKELRNIPMPPLTVECGRRQGFVNLIELRHGNDAFYKSPLARHVALRALTKAFIPVKQVFFPTASRCIKP